MMYEDLGSEKKMAMTFVYQCGKLSWAEKLSYLDWRIVEAIRCSAPNEVAVLFDVDSVGMPQQVHLQDFRMAIAGFRNAVQNSSSSLFKYDYRPEKIPMHPLEPGWGSGLLSGILVPGDGLHYYAICTGFNQCEVEKYPNGLGGRDHRVGVDDLRDAAHFDTANFGRIVFRKRRISSQLKKLINELDEFANSCDSDVVIKTVS